MKDWPKAEKYLRTYIELCPDSAAYDQLASNWLAQGNEGKWLSTLEESLKQPDYRLDHAQTNAKIAERFMKLGKYEKAEPYATAAAESWANFGMRTAAECEAKLGHMEAAELWMQRVEERYGPAGTLAAWKASHRKGTTQPTSDF